MKVKLEIEISGVDERTRSLPIEPQRQAESLQTMRERSKNKEKKQEDMHVVHNLWQ